MQVRVLPAVQKNSDALRHERRCIGVELTGRGDPVRNNGRGSQEKRRGSVSRALPPVYTRDRCRVTARMIYPRLEHVKHVDTDYEGPRRQSTAGKKNVDPSTRSLARSGDDSASEYC